jgi:ribonuclease Y
MEIAIWIGTVILAAALSAGISYLLAARQFRKRLAGQVDEWVRQAQQQLQEAQQQKVALDQERAQFEREREALLRETTLKAREEAHRILEQAEQEAREKRGEVLRLEQRLLQREELLEHRFELLEQKEQALLEREVIILDTIQRCVVEHVGANTITVVHLPSDDIKGRIIGREGRNVRHFEHVTGVDVIIDDTPEAVVLSCFDPVRREIARLTLVNLIQDGRIHPTRIEEEYERARVEIERRIWQAGEEAVLQVGLTGMHPEIVRTLGKLRYRTSYAQNVLDHSIEVAQLAGLLAAELKLDTRLVKRAALLHDIGKALENASEGPHALVGMEFLQRYGESELVCNAVGAHHYDIEPASLEAHVVIIADSISAARPGARRESLQHYLNRMQDLERIAMSFEWRSIAAKFSAFWDRTAPGKRPRLRCYWAFSIPLRGKPMCWGNPLATRRPIIA